MINKTKFLKTGINPKRVREFIDEIKEQIWDIPKIIKETTEDLTEDLYEQPRKKK